MTQTTARPAPSSVRPVLRTELCDVLGVEYPVMLAGMGPIVANTDHGGVAGVELVAAVSNAGGLGVLGAAAFSPDELAEQIRLIRELTDKPFGVDILLPSGSVAKPAWVPDDPRELLPAEQRAVVEQIRRDLDLPEVRVEIDPSQIGWRHTPQDQVDVITGLGVKVFAVGLGSPGPYVEQVHTAGGVVVSLVGTPRVARQVVADGADVVVAQGYDAGGHTGHIGTMALLPQVVDAVGDQVPVVAAGGIGDGRGLAAALTLGCAGAWVGTAFLATYEAHLSELRKQRVLDASAEDTRITRVYSGKTMRNIRNPLIDAWEASGARPLPFGVQGMLIGDLMASAWAAGREDLLMNAAGQVSGMLTGLRPAAEVLESLVAGCVDVLTRGVPERVTLGQR